MTLDEYQSLAARTINPNLIKYDQEKHALHGIVGEVGEIHSLYQKTYQGHEMDEEHLQKELGDLMWFIAELCSSYNWKLSDICETNINKLKARYPQGFEEKRSKHRKAGDI